jgi:hypothetical protein
MGSAYIATCKLVLPGMQSISVLRIAVILCCSSASEVVLPNHLGPERREDAVSEKNLSLSDMTLGNRPVSMCSSALSCANAKRGMIARRTGGAKFA